jgi:hypothetical protein
LEADSFGFVGEISDFYCDLIELVELNVLEDDFCGYDLEILSINTIFFGVGSDFIRRALVQRLHSFIYL